MRSPSSAMFSRRSEIGTKIRDNPSATRIAKNKEANISPIRAAHSLTGLRSLSCPLVELIDAPLCCRVAEIRELTPQIESYLH